MRLKRAKVVSMGFRVWLFAVALSLEAFAQTQSGILRVRITIVDAAQQHRLKVMLSVVKIVGRTKGWYQQASRT